ncbi:MAG: hypothetical protein LH477_18550, partial [Nocardioides sp.]|nr:hypothetical protein [Nocardioides sp.]
MTAGGNLPVPDAFRRHAGQVWGEAGRDWIETLPEHVAACAETWSLGVGAVFDLSHHWVAAARTPDGADVVLKLGVPGEAHLEREAAVLRRWDGRGAVRLLRTD